ncbi:MAG: hypothetical protein JNN15_10260, partial [Blastocatellia bacterium]|nr:hypothetical protein [Blastocatellia bacterium]
SASFNHPQGLTLDNHLLYVADTENHLIRRVNLINKQVETVAGTGQQSRSYYQEGQSVEIALNSPWDLKLIGNLLFIAMAGSHQIWLMDTESQMIGPFAGTGAEACMDGSVESAAFAQPSGLAFDGQHLYIADSEISSIRAINLTEEPTVVSVVGSCHLFGFGDVDASRQDVRLQHPLGIEVVDNCLYIADTYNHKIKVVDLKTVSCKTVFGDGKGLEDGQNAKFYEPSGLSILGRKLYIADTNNHAIRVADLNTKEVKTLEIIGLES